METAKPLKKQKSYPRLFMLALASALVLWGFAGYVLTRDSTPGAPQYVGSLKLVSLLEGQEALDNINQLHGTRMDLKNPFVAAYQPPNGGEFLMVWAGDAVSDAAAGEMINRMVDAINRTNGPFSNPRQVNVTGLDIWQTDGDDGNFYFYTSAQRANRVVWLTIQSVNAGRLLEQALSEF